MWLLASKVCAYLAAGTIGVRILRLVVITGFVRRDGGDDARTARRRAVAWDRALRWSFYLFMAAALGAFVLHTRQR